MTRPSPRLLLAAMLIFGLVTSPAVARAADDGRDIGAMVMDAPIRLLAGLRLLAGCALLVPSTFFAAFPSAIDGDMRPIEETFELHVGEPWEYLVERPWGEDLAGV